MKPGRELDVLIAEKVMGWTKIRHFDNPFESLPGARKYFGVAPRGGKSMRGGEVEQPIPSFSTDIAPAWMVLEALRARDPESFFTLSFVHEASLKLSGTVYKTVGSSDAHAICLIALKAVGVEIP